MNKYKIYKINSDFMIFLNIENKEIKRIIIREKEIEYLYFKLSELDLKLRELIEEIFSLMIKINPEVIIDKFYHESGEIYLLIKEISKEELIKRIYDTKTSNKRNLMGCSEDWYNELYSLKQTFKREELESMDEKELENLMRLAYNIAEALY